MLLGAFIFCITRSQAAEHTDTAAIEKAVLDTYAEIIKAAEKVDADKVFSYVLDNDKGCLISDGKLTMTRQEALDNYKFNSRNTAGVVYTIDKKYITVLSSDMAVMAAEGRYEATGADGRTVGSPMAQTVLFVRKGNEWKVLHSHTSLPNP
jgi:ketosteroid isomerase-like protein